LAVFREAPRPAEAALKPGKEDELPLPTCGQEIVFEVILTSSLGHRMKERYPLVVNPPMKGILITLK
jgi:hypothetical protein